MTDNKNKDNKLKNKVGRPSVPDDERKDYKITIRVDKAFKDKISKLADSKGISVGELIRLAVEDYKNKI